MTELPDLPSLPDYHRPGTPAGLQAAVAAGRARRNRFLAGAGAGAMSAVLVLAGVLLFDGGSNNAARVVDTVATSPDPSATPGPTSSATEAPAAAPSSSEAPTPAEEPQPSPEPNLNKPAESAEPNCNDNDCNEGAVEPRPAAERDEYTERPRELDAPVTCGVSTDKLQGPTFASASACGYGSGSSDSVSRGGQVTGTYGICVPTGGNPVQLGFDTGREHEVRVYRGGDVVFVFSQTVIYPQGDHERTLPSARCLEWRGTWDTTLTDGSQAPSGSYRVRVSVDPEVVNGQRTSPGDGGYVEFDVEVR